MKQLPNGAGKAGREMVERQRRQKIHSNLEENLAWLEKRYAVCSDLICRRVQIAGQNGPEACLCYFDGMTSSQVVHDQILYPLCIDGKTAGFDAQWTKKTGDCLAFLQQHLLPVGEIRQVTDLVEGSLAMMNGDVLLLLDGCTGAFVIDAKGFPHRSVERSRNETVLRGPQEAFTETLRTNTALIRRRLRTPLLKLEEQVLGQLTQTQVAVVYLEGVANDNLVQEIHRRLDNLSQVDSILDSGCIEQYLEDAPFSVFPQLQYTERPDKVAASLLEGRVAIVVDGSPEVLLAPLLFVQLLQSPEDYYNRMIPGTFMRWIRYMGLVLAMTLPSLYVAVTSFHPELLPTPLLLSIASAREGVPFPAFVEALLMELCFELLREASLRLPGAIGNTIGIVGALVIGDAAVSAHLVAPQMVIVVAITAIGSFAVPSMEASYPIRLLRFPLMLLAAALGLYGVVLGWFAIGIYLVHLRSFGYPYLEPLAPWKTNELRDVLVRPPRWQMMLRPLFREPAHSQAAGSFWKRRIQPLQERGDESRGKQ